MKIIIIITAVIVTSTFVMWLFSRYSKKNIHKREQLKKKQERFEEFQYTLFSNTLGLCLLYNPRSGKFFDSSGKQFSFPDSDEFCITTRFRFNYKTLNAELIPIKIIGISNNDFCKWSSEISIKINTDIKFDYIIESSSEKFIFAKNTLLGSICLSTAIFSDSEPKIGQQLKIQFYNSNSDTFDIKVEMNIVE